MSRPVIFVPGLPGSHLHDRDGGKRLFLSIPSLLFPEPRREVLARLRGPDDLAAADTVATGAPIRRAARILFFDVAKQAESLYDILRRIDVELVPFGWDWRRPVYDRPAADALRAAIEDLHVRAGRKVTVIVHSTGGLLLRHLLERRHPALAERIERVIAFGVPWAGTLKSLEVLAGQLGITLISRRQAQELLAHSWAAFDLLPPDPAKTDLVDAEGNPLGLVVGDGGGQASALLERGWFDPQLRAAMVLRADGADLELGRRAASLELGGRALPVTNVVGFGETTTVRARLAGAAGSAGIEFTAAKEDATLDGGDGTIPRRSAAWLRGPGVDTYHVPVGVDPGASKSPHSTLWRNPGGRNLLRHLLGDRSLEPFVYGAVDGEDFIEGATVRLRLVALDGGGAPLAAARVRTVGLSPGPELEEAFAPARQGRHLLRIPRSRIRRTGDGRLRRLTVEVGWREGATDRTQDLSFFLQP